MTPAPEPDPPISVAIDVRPLAGIACGYTVYLASVIEPLRRAGFRLTLLTNLPPNPDFLDLAGCDLRVFGDLDDRRWERLDLPRALASDEFHVYFTGANLGIPWRKNPRVRYILGLLDIIPYKFPQHYLLANKLRRFRQKRLRDELIAALISIARADSILTISRASALDIARLFRRRNVTSCLIRLPDVPAPAPRPVLDQFVYVGGSDVRKKPDVVIRAFARFAAGRPDYRLLLVGQKERYYGLIPLIESLGIRDRVVLTDYVDHDTKFRILAESRAMVYLSLYEGYGLAIGEAIQAGIPVIAGRGGAQAEVGGAAVRYVVPTDPVDVAAAMAEMLDDSARAAWVDRGREQLRVLTGEEIEATLVGYFREQARLAGGRTAPAPART